MNKFIKKEALNKRKKNFYQKPKLIKFSKTKQILAASVGSEFEIG
jgi:hypothetical protein